MQQQHEREYDLDVPIAWRKGIRFCTKYPISKFLGYSKLSSKFKAITESIDDEVVPKDIYCALQEEKWRKAVMEEMLALEKNGTWEIVDLPYGKHTVGSKWVFTIKYNSDGRVDRYKARLVAQGFTQMQSLDYEETFASVAKLNSICVLLSLAINLDRGLQLDIKNVFLNGELEGEVSMRILPGFERKDTRGKVCTLKKSLYVGHGSRDLVTH